MGLDLDFSGHWVYYGNRIDVELIVPAHYPDVPEQTYAVANVVRESATQSDLVLHSARLDQTSRAFHLWASQMDDPTVVPNRGDLLRDLDADQLYQVVGVEVCDEGARYRCVCARRVETT